MIKLPIEGKWSQPNTSDKFGSLFATKNINLDEEGYIKLSPRTVRVIDENTNDDFGIPHGIGQYGPGSLQVATTSNANFEGTLSETSLTLTEDSGTAEPTMNQDSSARFFQGRWWATTATAILSKVATGSSSATWTDSTASLTSGVKHFLEVFASRVTLCVTNGNVVKQYTASTATLTNTTDLTIPSDFEIVKIAYNNGKMGVITKMATVGTDTPAQEAKFYIWDGSSTSATGYGVGSDTCMDIVPYKSTFAILTRAGELKTFNGGGLTTVAAFPFYNRDKRWSDTDSIYPTGDSMTVDGDIIYLNLGLELNEFGRRKERMIPECPSGIWCYDPRVGGLYHRWSPSNSQVYAVNVLAGGTNISTNILTANAGTIPATGNIARYLFTGGTGITGLSLNHDYYIIKHSSTTFSLATTYENAVAGTRIDLTAQDSSTSYFHMYDIVDFANTYTSDTGAVAIFRQNTPYFRDVIFGGDYGTITDVTESNDALCMAVPFLENRGWFVTPKVFSGAVEDVSQNIVVKFRPLKTADKVIVKVKTSDVIGLPVTSPNIENSDTATWSNDAVFYTYTDLSEAKTYLDSGDENELEVELVAGAGAGQMVNIQSISGPATDGLYAVTLEESVTGASSGRQSYFIIDNWRVIGQATSASDEGYVTLPIGKTRKFFQFKVELRGSDTTIEEIQLDQLIIKP